MPVRRPLRLVLWSFVPLIAAAFLYGWATRPARLRAGCAEALDRFGLSLVGLGGIRFTPWGGLELTDLRLLHAGPVPPSPAGAEHDCQIHVRSLRIRCGWLGLLGGRFKPASLEIEGATVDLIQARNEGSQTSPPSVGTVRGMTPVPAPAPTHLRVRRADVRLWTQGLPPQLRRRWILDVYGEPVVSPGLHRAPAYALRIEQVGGSAIGPRAASAGPLFEMLWQRDGIHAVLDWLDLELLAALAPRTVAPWLAQLDAEGSVRMAHLTADARGLAELHLQLAEASFCVPLEDSSLQPAERFLRVTQAGGELHWRRERPTDPAVAGAAADASFDLRGLVNGAPARLRGEFSRIRPVPDATVLTAPTLAVARAPFAVGDYLIECQVEPMEFPSRERHAALFRSSVLPGPVRAFLHDYEPAGRFSMSFSVRPPDASDTAFGNGPQVDGVMELHGASCRYFRFPYAVHDITGRVRLAGGVLHLDGLVGRHGSALITGRGRVLSTEAWAGLDLTFDATNVPLDNELLAALPADYQRLWREVQPVGLCDLRTVVRRASGSAETGPLEADVTVDARLVAGSLSLPDGEAADSRTRMHGADGWIRIAGGEVHVIDLGGQLGSGAIRVEGTIGVTGGPAADAAGPGTPRDLRVELSAAPLSYSSEMVSADPGHHSDRAVRSLGRIHFEGTGEVWGRLAGSNREEYWVRVRDGVLTGFDPGETWRDVRGWILTRSNAEQQVSLESRRDGGRLELSGRFLRQGGDTAPATLSLSAEDVHVDRLLRGLVPPAWTQVREAIGVSGTGRVRAQLGSDRLPTAAGNRPHAAAEPDPARPDPKNPGATVDSPRRLQIELEAEKMCFEFLPLELRSVQLGGAVDELGYEITRGQARCAEGGEIELRGTGKGWPPFWTELSIAARGLSAGPGFLNALPAAVAEPLRRMELRGTLDVNLERLRIEQCGRRWGLAGSVRTAEADFELGLPVRVLDGELSGECEGTEDQGLALAGELRIYRGTLWGRPVTNLTSRILRAPGERWVRLEQLHGSLCGGQVFGHTCIDPATGDYELSVTLQDVALRELVSRESPADPAAASGDGGRLDGRVFLRGRGKQVHGRLGGGELRIRGASWLALPVSASLLAAGRSARQPVEGDPQVAGLRFVWEGDTLRFTFVEIQTPELRFVGAGRWDLRSDALTMTLVAAPPAALGGLGNLLSGAGAKLMQYRVTGTAAAPRVTVEPLHGISQALEQLLRTP